MHTSAPKGKKVRIKLKTGDIIITKFIKRDEQSNIITEAGKFRKKQLKSFSIYKNTNSKISRNQKS